MKRTTRFNMSRRTVLGGLTTLPAFLPAALADETATVAQAFTKSAARPTSANQVLSVMDFEALARDALPPAHFGYIATGSDDDRTVVRNHEAYSDYQIRARRFVDVGKLTTATTVFGAPWKSPLYASAVSSMRAFHPDAELAVARAAKSRSTQLMLSTGASSSPEEVIEARGAPIWQQIYPTDDWSVTQGLIRRGVKAGATAIVVTVDSPGARNNQTLDRARLVDNRECTACHIPGKNRMWQRAPLFAGLDVSRVNWIAPAGMPPDYLARMRDFVKVKLVYKGIMTGEDAAMAIDQGADGIVVSNHGGRNEETLRASFDSLPEVVAAARGRVPVFLDGGIRRGTDIFKALALGAAGVGIGRPQAWGLAAFGQPGVEAVLDILNTELTNIMRQAGTPTIAGITRDSVLRTRD
jgi:isopentenyl diphosphate isomerase/L-lactate dehydrogenase-like FMN-dependent dehydrogenase